MKLSFRNGTAMIFSTIGFRAMSWNVPKNKVTVWPNFHTFFSLSFLLQKLEKHYKLFQFHFCFRHVPITKYTYDQFSPILRYPRVWNRPKNSSHRIAFFKFQENTSFVVIVKIINNMVFIFENFCSNQHFWLSESLWHSYQYMN